MKTESEVKSLREKTVEVAIWLIEEKGWSDGLTLAFMQEAPNLSEEVFNRFYNEYLEAQD